MVAPIEVEASKMLCEPYLDPGPDPQIRDPGVFSGTYGHLSESMGTSRELWRLLATSRDVWDLCSL